jgi:hypothetical protein
LKIVVDTRALFKEVLMETQFWGILRAGWGGYYRTHAGLAHVSTLLRYSKTQVYSFEFFAEKIWRQLRVVLVCQLTSFVIDNYGVHSVIQLGWNFFILIWQEIHINKFPTLHLDQFVSSSLN